MRYGIISDIHGNLEALTIVLEELENSNIDKYMCLGDIVGYGANPNECITLIREKTDIIIAGNHDHAAVGLTRTDNFNPYAKRAVEWTNKTLITENIEFLKGLSLNLVIDETIMIVHSTPSRPEIWNYIFSTYEARREFSYYSEPIGFIGHSHQPLIFHGDGERCYLYRDNRITINLEERYLINVGSVGQPRDGNPKACYCIYDNDESIVEIYRTEYDVETARQKIIDAGLPEVLGDRLIEGQ